MVVEGGSTTIRGTVEVATKADHLLTATQQDFRHARGSHPSRQRRSLASPETPETPENVMNLLRNSCARTSQAPPCRERQARTERR
jgi:hypothetical protein